MIGCPMMSKYQLVSIQSAYDPDAKKSEVTTLIMDLQQQISGKKKSSLLLLYPDNHILVSAQITSKKNYQSR